MVCSTIVLRTALAVTDDLQTTPQVAARATGSDGRYDQVAAALHDLAELGLVEQQKPSRPGLSSSWRRINPERP